MANNPNPNRVLNRAFAAGAGLTAAIVAITGVFIAHISSSFAASHSSTSSNSSTSGTDNGTGQISGGGQLSGPRQNQGSVGGSHGS